MERYGDVLYLALEDNPRRLQRRLKKYFGRDRSTWPARLTIVTEWKQLDQGGLEAIEEWCWSEALARLDPNKPPGDVPMRRWVRFLDDAHAFVASDWPRQAGELGWSALDLFGCHPVAPYARHDRRGLVWSFGECGGGRLVAMTGDTAVIERPTGSHQTFRRLVAAGDVVLPWELRE